MGCAGHAEYYASIAEANARIAESEQARYAALTELASSGDGNAAMAAAMVVAKDWPESFDLTPLNDAIAANA